MKGGQVSRFFEDPETPLTLTYLGYFFDEDSIKLRRPVRAVWPEDQAQRPQNDPVSIYIDDSGHLYDPGHDQARPTRRVFYGIAGMSRRERYDFYRGHLGGQTLQHFLRGDEAGA